MSRFEFHMAMSAATNESIYRDPVTHQLTDSLHNGLMALHKAYKDGYEGNDLSHAQEAMTQMLLAVRGSRIKRDGKPDHIYRSAAADAIIGNNVWGSIVGDKVTPARIVWQLGVWKSELAGIQSGVLTRETAPHMPQMKAALKDVLDSLQGSCQSARNRRWDEAHPGAKRW
ncbi:MAG: hypothetical protein AB7G06_09535 [Bdellovibrionales bacterium]